LRTEEHSAFRREYVDGRVFAMTGTTLRHNILVNNLYSALRSHAKGGPCKAYTLDVKVHVKSANSFYYPDVVLSCSKSNDSDLIVESPVFIAEVLSRSTSLVDRREKVVTYKQLPFLKEYLIVHQTKMKVECHRKIDSNSWEILEISQGNLTILESASCGALTLRLDDLYEGLQFEHGFIKEELIDYEIGEEGDLDLEY
jgi:Uma2 family endonuclease